MNFISLTNDQILIRRRILEISHELKLSHLGSCLSAVDLIDCVYKVKNKDEKFVLSNGHAAVALYVVLEKYGYIKDSNLIKKLHVHPDRNPHIDIQVSTGSLGHGLPIAIGMALADRNRSIYCMISDGECMEGSVWESVRVIADFKVFNLKLILNANGWGAYDPIDLTTLIKRLRSFGLDVVEIDGHNIKQITKALSIQPKDKPLLIFAKTTVEQFPFLKGQDAHYYILDENTYNLVMHFLK